MKQDQPQRSAQKKSFFEDGMKGDHVLVHLNARSGGVDVPAGLAKNASLTLKFSYYFQGETTHDDEAITGYLRFGGNYTKCVVPWDSVWGMTTDKGENRIWPEDIPREVMLQMARAKIASVGKKLFGVKPKADTEVAETSGGEGTGATAGASSGSNPETGSVPEPLGPQSGPPKKPGLKRVK